MSKSKKGYAFVIDTDSYAGNFEREMTAHITGIIGECEVGKEYIEKLSIDFEEIVKQVPDENGCRRPTDCWESPNGSYDSVAIFFEKRPTTEQIEFMKERAKTFNQKNSEINTYFPGDIKILGFRLIEFVSSTKEESI